jgi:membrane associated rhomboid family serine protease
MIPYKSDAYVSREPKANFIIIISMIVFHILGWLSGGLPAELLKLDITNPFPGIFTMYFVHADIFHLVGNLIFLWTFGNVICSRLGNIGYTITFFMIGILSSSFHILISDRSAIGASGAITGIVAIYFILFPNSKISLGYLNTYTGAGKIDVKAKNIIAIYFLLDLLGSLNQKINVAYGAHIAGYLAGLILTYLFVKFDMIEYDETDKPLFKIN